MLLNSEYWLWMMVALFSVLSGVLSREWGATMLLVLLPIIHLVLFHLYVVYFSSRKSPESRGKKVAASNVGLTFAFILSFAHTYIMFLIGEGAGYLILGSLVVVIVVSIPMYMLTAYLYSVAVSRKVYADDTSGGAD